MQRTKSRGPKGFQIEVRARRATRLLVFNMKIYMSWGGIVVGGGEEDKAGYGRLKQCEHSLFLHFTSLHCRLLLHTRKEAAQSRLVVCGEDISSGRPPDSSVIGAESKFGSAREVLKNCLLKPLQNRGEENPSHTLRCGKVLDQFWLIEPIFSFACNLNSTAQASLFWRRNTNMRMRPFTPIYR